MSFIEEGWKELSQELLRYGSVLTDDFFREYFFDEFGEVDGAVDSRIRLIRYEDSIYYHKMRNGKIVDIKEIQNAASKDLG